MVTSRGFVREAATQLEEATGKQDSIAPAGLGAMRWS